MADENAVVKANPTRFEVMNQVEFGEGGVQLATLAQAKVWAAEVAKSGLAPKGLDTEEKVLLAAQTGMELGFTPMRALQAVVVVNGRATLMGEAALALIRNSGLLEPGTSIQVGCRPTTEEEKLAGNGDLLGFCRTQRRGEAPAETVFSQGDAKKAGLWGRSGPWSQYPKRMLQARAIGFHMRDYWSDIGNGLMVADEARDVPPPRDVTPVKAKPPSEPDPLFGPSTSPEAGDEVEEAEWSDADTPVSAEADRGAEAMAGSPESPDLEIDPETGEVIPPWVGQGHDQ